MLTTAAPIYQNLIVRMRTPLAQLLPVLATVFGSELSMMTIISTHDPYWRRRGDPDRLSASQPRVSVINRLISGFHDCKWYCESLSLIKSGLTELPIRQAHELVHPRRADPRPGRARAA